MKKIAFLGGLLLIFLTGCSQVEAVPTIGITPSKIPIASVLPHSLYFLSDRSGSTFQIWRLSADLKLLDQVTDEPNDIIDFDVSRVDGRVAYITENQLYLINADGSGRTLLVDGSMEGNQNNEFRFTQTIRGVRWSPDGQILSYGMRGVHLYFIPEDKDLQVIENVITEDPGGGLLSTALYSPISWAPDGNSLLLELGMIEAGTLAIYHLENEDLVRLGNEGTVCCHPAWAQDSRSIVVASPTIGMLPAGLWRYDARTGAETELIHHTSEDGTLNFASWPIELKDGNLRFFYNNMPAFPVEEVSMVMVHTGNDGVSDQNPVRSEYWINYEVLWTEDGSLAVTVQPATGVPPGSPLTGPILLIPASSEAVIPLAGNGYILRWGP